MNKWLLNSLIILYLVISVFTLFSFGTLFFCFNETASGAGGLASEVLLRDIIEHYVLICIATMTIILFHKFNQFFPFVFLVLLAAGCGVYAFFETHLEALSDRPLQGQFLQTDHQHPYSFGFAELFGWIPCLIIVALLAIILLFLVCRQPTKLARTVHLFDEQSHLSGLYISFFVLITHFYGLSSIYLSLKNPQLLVNFSLYWVQSEWRPFSFGINFWRVFMQFLIVLHQWIFVHAVFLFTIKYTVNQLYSRSLNEQHHEYFKGKSSASMRSLSTAVNPMKIYEYVFSSAGAVILFSCTGPLLILPSVIYDICQRRRPNESSFPFEKYSYQGLVLHTIQSHDQYFKAQYPFLAEGPHVSLRPRLDSTTSSTEVPPFIPVPSFIVRVQLLLILSVFMYICNPYISFETCVYQVSVPYLSFAMFLTCCTFTEASDSPADDC